MQKNFILKFDQFDWFLDRLDMDSVWSIKINDDIFSCQSSSSLSASVSSNVKQTAVAVKAIDAPKLLLDSPVTESKIDSGSSTGSTGENKDILSYLTLKHDWSKTQYRHLLPQLTSSSAVQLVAWSTDNFIAFVLNERKEQLDLFDFDDLLSNSSSVGNSININDGLPPQQQQQQQPLPQPQPHGSAGKEYATIYVVRVDLPHEYMTIRTKHTSAIKYLEWSNQVQGSLLMSVDLQNNLSLWKKMDQIDDWESMTSTLNIPYLLLCKWITINASYLPISCPQQQSQQQSPLQQFNINPTNEILTQSFITLSKDGKINIVTYSMLESSWKQIQGEIIIPMYYSIDCADVISLKDETIMIAIYSEKMGNVILLYKVTYDIYTNYVQVYLTDRINLNDYIESDDTLLNTKRNIKVNSIVFDNSDNALIILKSGLKCSILYRWEKREIPQSQHSAILSLFGSGSSSHRDVTEWTCTNKQYYFNKPTNNSNHDSDNDNDSVEEVPLISSVHFTQVTGVLWLNFSNGKLECIKSSSFEPIASSMLSEVNSNSPDDERILSMASSPNGALVAYLSTENRVQLLSLPIRAAKATKDHASTWLSHLFQHSILKSTDWWDLLVLLRIYANSPETLDAYHHVIVKLSTECQYYYPSTTTNSNVNTNGNTGLSQCKSTLDAIKATIYRMVNGRELAFIDSQAKAFIYYLQDTLKSSYQPLLQESANTEDKENMSYLIDWAIDFTYFFLRNAFYIDLVHKKDTALTFNIPQEFLKVEVSNYYSLYYLENKQPKPFSFPFISLFYDINIQLALLELLNFSKAFKEKYVVQSNKVKYKLSDAKLLLDIYGPFLNDLSVKLVDASELKDVQSFIKDNYNTILTSQSPMPNIPIYKSFTSDRLQSYTEEMLQLVKQHVPQSINNGINEISMTNTFTILDLDPPLDGFLDQNPLTAPAAAAAASSTATTPVVNSAAFNSQAQQKSSTIGGESAPVAFKYAPKSSDYINMVYDILTRIPIPTRIEKPIRKCTRCHRMTILRRTTSLFWSDRWSLACPLCGGKWKIYNENVYIQQILQTQSNKNYNNKITNP